MDAARLRVVVDADTRRAQAGLMGVHATMSKTAKMAAGLTGSLIGAGSVAFAVKKTGDVLVGFEKQMSSVRAVTDANARQMKALSKTAVDLGSKTGLGARNAARGLTELAKGGVALNKLGPALKGTLALAAAGQMDVAQASETVANALNLFALRGKDASHVADALARAANDTTADVADFAMALSQGGGAAKAAGLSFDETVVALEALAKAGVKNSDAGTSLKTALVQLASPSKKAAEAAKQLGLNFFDAHGSMKPLPAVAEMLRSKLGKLTDQQRLSTLQAIAGTDGFRALLALYDQGPAKITKLGKSLEKQGDAAKTARIQQDNLAGGFNRIKAALESLTIAKGGGFLAPIKDGAFAVADFIDELRTGKGAGGEFAASVSGAFKDIKSAVGDAKREFDSLKKQFQSGFNIGGDKAKGDIGGILGDVKDVANAVKGVAKGSGAFKALGAEAKGAFGGMKSAAKLAGSAVRGDVGGAVKGVTGMLKGQAQILAGPFIGAAEGAKNLAGAVRGATSEVGALEAAIKGLPSSKEIRINVSGNGISGVVTGADRLTPGPQTSRSPSRPSGSGTQGGGPARRASTARASSVMATAAARKPPAPVVGVNPNNGKKEYHTPKQWAEIRADYKARKEAAKRRKRKQTEIVYDDPTPGGGNAILTPPFAHGQDPDDLPTFEPGPGFGPGGMVAKAQAGVALAGLGGGLGAQEAALRGLVGTLQQALAQAQAGGDPDKISQAANDLADASGRLNDVWKEIEQAPFVAGQQSANAALIAAQINTPNDPSDNLAALNTALGNATQAYQDAVAKGDLAGQINWGQELLGLREAIEGLNESTQQLGQTNQALLDAQREQIDALKRDVGTGRAEIRALNKYITGVVNGDIGARWGRGSTTPRTLALASR